MHLNGFDKIAWLYDLLAKLVFGNRLMKAQVAQLHYLGDSDRVLILGGGTGAIAEELLRQRPACRIVFIDASQGMIGRAQKRPGLFRNIQFIHGTERTIPVDVTFDALITPFYLDMFPTNELPDLINHISKHISDQGLWLVADFCHSKRLSHRLLRWTMYRFFRLAAGIRAHALPDWDAALQANGWAKSESIISGKLIESALYRRRH